MQLHLIAIPDQLSVKGAQQLGTNYALQLLQDSAFLEAKYGGLRLFGSDRSWSAELMDAFSKGFMTVLLQKMSLGIGEPSGMKGLFPALPFPNSVGDLTPNIGTCVDRMHVYEFKGWVAETLRDMWSHLNDGTFGLALCSPLVLYAAAHMTGGDYMNTHPSTELPEPFTGYRFQIVRSEEEGAPKNRNEYPWVTGYLRVERGDQEPEQEASGPVEAAA